MSIVSEFRTFVRRGNVIDLAVGVIIGAAFGKIVTSLVNDVLMPPIGMIVGGINFTALKLHLGGPPDHPVTLNYGSFLQTLVDFFFIAVCVFALVKLMNAVQQAKDPSPREPGPEEKLLAEIRDLLKARA
jgi:large conductance mechanosensitive channel